MVASTGWRSGLMTVVVLLMLALGDFCWLPLAVVGWCWCLVRMAGDGDGTGRWAKALRAALPARMSAYCKTGRGQL
eukprot:13873179-Alexandrium_andersonii.AAC.1